MPTQPHVDLKYGCKIGSSLHHFLVTVKHNGHRAGKRVRTRLTTCCIWLELGLEPAVDLSGFGARSGFVSTFWSKAGTLLWLQMGLGVSLGFGCSAEAWPGLAIGAGVAATKGVVVLVGPTPSAFDIDDMTVFQMWRLWDTYVWGAEEGAGTVLGDWVGRWVLQHMTKCVRITAQQRYGYV